MVAQGTIEERILALQERKAQLAQSIYGGEAARREPLFTESDLSSCCGPWGATESLLLSVHCRCKSML